MNPDTKAATFSVGLVPALPWWRVGMVWLVLAGPLSVVVASLATAVIAWRHIDPLIPVNRDAGAEVAEPADLKSPLAPAMKARNHVATPALGTSADEGASRR